MSQQYFWGRFVFFVPLLSDLEENVLQMARTFCPQKDRCVELLLSARLLHYL